MPRYVSCYYCGKVIDETEERAYTEGKPRHIIHATCTKKLSAHERELVSDNWHVRTQAKMKDMTAGQLIGTVKDARAAAECAKGMQNEGKYLDEMYYAAAELRRRGMSVPPKTVYDFRFVWWPTQRGDYIGEVRTVQGNFGVGSVTPKGYLHMDMLVMNQREVSQADLMDWWNSLKKTLGFGAPLLLPAPRAEAYKERMKVHLSRYERQSRRPRLTR